MQIFQVNRWGAFIKLINLISDARGLKKMKTARNIHHFATENANFWLNWVETDQRSAASDAWEMASAIKMQIISNWFPEEKNLNFWSVRIRFWTLSAKNDFLVCKLNSSHAERGQYSYHLLRSLWKLNAVWVWFSLWDNDRFHHMV